MGSGIWLTMIERSSGLEAREKIADALHEIKLHPKISAQLSDRPAAKRFSSAHLNVGILQPGIGIHVSA